MAIFNSYVKLPEGTLWQMNSSTLKSPFLSGNSFFQALSARFELLIYWRVQSNNITDVFQEPEFQ